MKNNQTNEFDTPFFKHLPLLMEKREQIIANPNYFMIPIQDIQFYGRACLVAGRVNCLPIGALLSIWSNEPITSQPCICGGTAVVVESVFNSLCHFTYTTFCLKCHTINQVKELGSSSHIIFPFFAALRAYSNITSVPSIELEELIKILQQNLTD